MKSKYKYILYISLILFFVSFAVRFLYVDTSIIDGPIRSDAKSYVTIASNLVNYGVYTHHNTTTPKPSGMITPGYPLFLTLIKSVIKDVNIEYKVVLYIQAILGSLTVVIAFLIAKKILPLWGAVILGLLMAFSPHQIVFSGYVLTETLFTFLLFCMMFLLTVSLEKINPIHFLFIGFVVGLSALVRPAILLFPFFIAPIIWFYKPVRSTGSAIGLLVLGVFILWLPWVAWKMVYSYDENTKNSAAASFAYGSYPNLIYDKATLIYPDDRARRISSFREDPKFNKMAKSLNYGAKVTFGRFKKEPAKYIRWYLYGKPLMYWKWDNNMSLQKGPFVYPVIYSIYHKTLWAQWSFRIIRFLHPILILMAVFATLVAIKDIFSQKTVAVTNTVLLMLISLPVYYTVVHSFLLPIPRYAIPVHGFTYLVGIFSIFMAGRKIYNFAHSSQRINQSLQWVYRYINDIREKRS